MDPRNFLAELKRRKVYGTAVAYAVIAWLLIQIATQTFPFFNVPNWATRLVILLLIVGFPLALVLSWAFELTPEGVRRVQDDTGESGVHRTSRKLIAVVAVFASLALGMFLFRISRPERDLPEVAPVQPLNAISEKSIAVLPFENLSANPENAFFADGVQDEILTNLARIADLKVISRISVMQYKPGIARNARAISQALGVANLLEGSVQREGGKVRVNAQLIDARNDTHVWAQTYDRDLADIFAIQTEIATKIVDQLRAKISPSEKNAIETPPTRDLTAYDLFIRAQALSIDLTNPIVVKEKAPQAIRLLEEAVARDPNFTRAFCLLSRVHGQMFWAGFDHTPARLALAKQAAEAALRTALTMAMLTSRWPITIIMAFAITSRREKN